MDGWLVIHFLRARLPSMTSERQRSGWMKVSKSNPCPICEHIDWCTMCDTRVKCMRIESEKPAAGDGGGWIHDRGVNSKPLNLPPPKPKRTDAECDAIFRPMAKQWFLAGAGQREKLAELIHVSAKSLELLRTGWDGSSWTTPERNAEGLVVGIATRPPIGKKKCVLDSRRGLTYTHGCLGYPGPVLIVEGASDVAAGLTMGLCVIGRPSNLGGAAYLSDLLKVLPGHREIVVVGERDEKDRSKLAKHKEGCLCCQQCWPGGYGAKRTSNELWKLLERRVNWKLLPDDAKDLRSWLNAKSQRAEDEKVMTRLGKSLLWRLKRC
jgi:hypothetical protein